MKCIFRLYTCIHEKAILINLWISCLSTKERKKERKKSVCVCVCVCVRKNERKRERKCIFLSEKEREIY